jgi:hypothetical protein
VKSRACAACWSEDVGMVVEEMRRVLDFSDWKSMWWLEQRERRYVDDEVLHEGLTAYAVKQARVWEVMSNQFADMWYPALVGYGIPIEWPRKYLNGDHPSVPIDVPEVEPFLGQLRDQEEVELVDDLFD